MSTPDSLPDDVETLQRLLLARDAELVLTRAEAAQARAEASSVEALVAHLRLEIEKLKRDLFGPRNERKERLSGNRIRAAISDHKRCASTWSVEGDAPAQRPRGGLCRSSGGRRVPLRFC